MLLLLFRNGGGGQTQSQPETLFARMWAQGQDPRRPGRRDTPASSDTESDKKAFEIKADPAASEPAFPRQAGPTPAELAAYSAMAAALVKADIKARLAEQQALEQAAQAVLVAELARQAEEQAELELLLLLL